MRKAIYVMLMLSLTICSRDTPSRAEKESSLFSRSGLECFLETLTTSEHVVLNAQVATIRNEIRASGESVVDCHKLLILCPDVAISGQWREIAKIAMAERWSFTFYADGDVRFANL